MPGPSPTPSAPIASGDTQSYLERDVIKCKRDLLERRSQTAGSSRTKLAKTDGILGGGWVGNGGSSSSSAQAAQPGNTATAKTPNLSHLAEDDQSDESLEDVRVTLSNRRMEEVNGKMRERHNTWVRQNWKQHQNQQEHKQSRHEELLQMFRPRKNAKNATNTAGQANYMTSDSTEPTRVAEGDFPPRPKSASAARSSEGMREREPATEDREWLERIEREREQKQFTNGQPQTQTKPPANTAPEKAASFTAANTSEKSNDASSQESLTSSHISSFKTAFETDMLSSKEKFQSSLASGNSASLNTAASSSAPSTATSESKDAEEQQKIVAMVQKLKSEGNAAYQSGRYSVAVMSYNKALEHDSHNVALHCNRAAAFLMLRYFDRCLADCQTAINIGPHYAKAHFRAGKALLLQCQPRAARRYYQTALQLVKQQNVQRQDLELIAMEERIEADLQAVTYVEQCRNAADQSKWADALHAAELAGEAVKEDAMQQLRLWTLTYVDPVMSRVELGHLVSLTQRHIEATNETNKAYLSSCANQSVTLLPVNPMVLADQLALLGRASFFSGHLYVSAAAQRLKEALHHVPDHREATQLLRFVNSFESNNREASSHYRSGQWTDAYQSYTNCLNLDPANHKLKSVTYNNRAAALLMMGNAAEAVKDCTAAINEDCTNVKAYARRSHAHHDLGNIDAALRDLELAAQLNPSYQQELKEVQRKKELLRSGFEGSQNSTTQGCSGGGGGGPSRGASRPSSAAGSRPSSAGASRRSSFNGGGSGGGGGGGGSNATSSNFVNNFPSAASHTSASNYYKLMGLDRNAANAAIMKKYKELALKYHPDRCKSEEQRPHHEKMFKDIGEVCGFVYIFLKDLFWTLHVGM